MKKSRRVILTGMCALTGMTAALAGAVTVLASGGSGPSGISSTVVQGINDIMNYQPPKPGDSITQTVDFSGNFLDNTVNFWNAYGNNISGGINHLSTGWDIAAGSEGFGSSYGGAVKWGGGIVKGANVAGNVMDTISTGYQLTHPQDNPYGSHSSLSFIYDTITTAQTICGWIDIPEIAIMGGTLGTTKNTWDDEATRTAFLDWADRSVIINTLDITMDNVNDYYTELFGGGRRDEWSLEDWRQQDYYDKLNFYAQMVSEGREKEFEWLRDRLLARDPRTGVTVLPGNVTAKKPNIYLYPLEETDISVSFANPWSLTETIPAYGDGWQVTARPDGMLTAEGGTYGYLFYESIVRKNIFQTEEGFLIPGDSRPETLREILEEYGFNERETEDFIEYWDGYLKEDVDYLMYPIDTEAVNEAMPLEFSVCPDSLTRIWFGFAPYLGELPETPVITSVLRQGFTVVEWGGAVIE